MRATLCCVVFFPFFSRLRSKERVSERARLERYRLIEGGREREREVEGGGGGRGCLVLLWVNLRTTLLSSPHRSLPLLPPPLLPIPSPHSLTSYTLPSHTPPPFLLPLSLPPMHLQRVPAVVACSLRRPTYPSAWMTGRLAAREPGCSIKAQLFIRRRPLISIMRRKDRDGRRAAVMAKQAYI